MRTVCEQFDFFTEEIVSSRKCVGFPRSQFDDAECESQGQSISSCVNSALSSGRNFSPLRAFPHPQSNLAAVKRENSPLMRQSSVGGGPAADKDTGQSRILLCEYCDASFTSSGGLSLHKATVHLQRRFVCNICGKVLKRKATLIHHMQSHRLDAQSASGT
ncbi:hypothetical protein ACOMHN_028555 [Nucella lapillus]